MIAHITAPVKLLDVAVFAELALWEQRPALQALCLTAVEEGALDAALIDRILPGLTAAGRTNLLRSLGRQRLIRRDGSPTSLGRRCADSGEAPQWEQGVYHLLVALHPLFGCEVLDFKRAGVEPHDRDFDSLVPLPDGFQIDGERVFASVFDPKTRFGIASLPTSGGRQAMCRWQALPDAELRWGIDPVSGDNTWHVQGRLSSAGGGSRDFESTRGGLDATVLEGIIARWDPRWDTQRGWWTMAYDGEPGSDRRTRFERMLTYDRVPIPGHGDFADVQVENVPVGPRTANDARDWAIALAIGELGHAPVYLTSEGWAAVWADVIEETPLAADAGPAPSPAEVEGARYGPGARARWLLRAAEDLEVAS